MSFLKYKDYVAVGDTVLVYLTPKQMYPLKMKENEVYQTRFGALKHDDIIGKRYGSKVECSRGYVHILEMSPELWTVTLPHRTQILYGTDISFILIQLQLKPGSIALEAGTGSGSLSHGIARTIAPHGKLFTFDFHEERTLAAREEFKEHGLDSIIIAQHRDVCTEGFNVSEQVDSVFLDLPHPWEAIESANSVLKSGGRICCFSPCIEQVQKSCQMLTELNFLDVETYECVLRPYEIRDLKLKRFHYHPNRIQKSTPVDNSAEFYAESGDSSKSEEDCEKEAEDASNQTKKTKLENQIKLGEKESDQAHYVIAYMNTEVAGHTGFLTFATKFISNAPSLKTET